MTIRCARCGADFNCDPGGDCWCKVPPYLPMPPGPEATCLCPDCLARARAAAARAAESRSGS